MEFVRTMLLFLGIALVPKLLPVLRGCFWGMAYGAQSLGERVWGLLRKKESTGSEGVPDTFSEIRKEAAYLFRSSTSRAGAETLRRASQRYCPYLLVAFASGVVSTGVVPLPHPLVDGGGSLNVKAAYLATAGLLAALTFVVSFANRTGDELGGETWLGKELWAAQMEKLKTVGPVQSPAFQLCLWLALTLPGVSWILAAAHAEGWFSETLTSIWVVSWVYAAFGLAVAVLGISQFSLSGALTRTGLKRTLRADIEDQRSSEWERRFQQAKQSGRLSKLPHEISAWVSNLPEDDRPTARTVAWRKINRSEQRHFENLVSKDLPERRKTRHVWDALDYMRGRWTEKPSPDEPLAGQAFIHARFIDSLSTEHPGACAEWKAWDRQSLRARGVDEDPGSELEALRQTIYSRTARSYVLDFENYGRRQPGLLENLAGALWSQQKGPAQPAATAAFRQVLSVLDDPEVRANTRDSKALKLHWSRDSWSGQDQEGLAEAAFLHLTSDQRPVSDDSLEICLSYLDSKLFATALVFELLACDRRNHSDCTCFSRFKLWSDRAQALQFTDGETPSGVEVRQRLVTSGAYYYCPQAEQFQGLLDAALKATSCIALLDDPTPLLDWRQKTVLNLLLGAQDFFPQPYPGQARDSVVPRDASTQQLEFALEIHKTRLGEFDEFVRAIGDVPWANRRKLVHCSEQLESSVALLASALEGREGL